MNSGVCSCASPAITVLFVDDDADTRFAYRLIASEQGMCVEVAGDGEEALALASVLAPDVIVLDVGLGRVDGVEASGLDVARRLRANAKTRAIPILIVSGTESARVRAEARAIGCEGHMVKPCSADELLGLVTALAGNRTREADTVGAVA